MFTKQHYEPVAKLLRNMPDKITRLELISKLADMFEEDSPKFDRHKFVKGCSKFGGYYG